ncbi:Potassium efflux system KefA protein [Fulvivirga imtechensis AK7]|uniref:Potassium efflux system KefA protein n=1 Tax=Fulvivirga imtechensis AK7 TaxID=1237149 RepID=L8JQJ2_9BACT|nr:mechanosensitive ion channel domain-containing protein [Fulvivirga imtechensis]ELR69642.1 Potassium efflux system KefA protein [Fulvivirga imtechensis AK7]
MEYFEQIKLFLVTQGAEVSFMLLKSILILVVGIQVIRFLDSSFNRFLERIKVDASLKPFLHNLFHNLLIVLLVLSVLTTLGVQMTSFIAMLGAAGLAVGLALQGTLQNFAGGVVLLTIKPFKVGDYIEGAGHAGTVREIRIFNTILSTPDNVQIIVPNGTLSNSAIKNFSANDTRRVDMVFGISYGDDIKKAKDILESLVKKDERVLQEPAPIVAVSSLGDSSVNFNVRPWVNRADYWVLYWDFHENVKLEFDKHGISIPFPQRDVHIYNEK